MPQLDFDGANSKVSADKIQGQSGTSVTVPTGHTLVGTDANSITSNGVNAVAVAPSTSGNVLTSTGSAWASAAAAGGGKCLAVVSTPLNSTPSTTSFSFVDTTGFAVTTGTLSTSSKLLIWGHAMTGTTTSYSGQMRMKITPSGGSAEYPYVGSGGTGVNERQNITIMAGYGHSHTSDIAGGESFVYLYTPSSTVSHIVQMEWRLESGGTMYLNRDINDNYGRGTSSITVMEIGA